MQITELHYAIIHKCSFAWFTLLWYNPMKYTWRCNFIKLSQNLQHCISIVLHYFLVHFLFEFRTTKLCHVYQSFFFFWEIYLITVFMHLCKNMIHIPFSEKRTPSFCLSWNIKFNIHEKYILDAMNYKSVKAKKVLYL